MAFFSKKRYYGRYKRDLEVPHLLEIQIRSYEEFLQPKVPYNKRANKGLEAIIREIFPIECENYKLEYLGYELGQPKFTPEECRKLGKTYGYTFKIKLRLIEKKTNKIKEEDIHIGEIPIMIGGGEFIINGTERVIVNQLHRSPGVDFIEEGSIGEKRYHSCSIIPELGHWLKISVSKKEVLELKINNNRKLAATTFIRVLDDNYANDEAILSLFYKVEEVELNKDNLEELDNKYLGKDVIIKKKDDKEEEIVRRIPAGIRINKQILGEMIKGGIEKIHILRSLSGNKKIDPLIINTLDIDEASSKNPSLKKTLDKKESYKIALQKIFKCLSNTTFNLDRAQKTFELNFKNPLKYKLGKVGRFRLNRKFKKYNHKVSLDEMTITLEDIVNSIKYIMDLREGKGDIDDVDNLGNKRVRTIVELAGDELRKGFRKLKKNIEEKMPVGLNNEENKKEISIQNDILSSYKIVSQNIETFFTRGELSQVIDQTNPLSQLTHERRLSALGPGGLDRKRAGFEVRDVHISHYGRICPIETPEGANIGLISSLSIYANIDEYGFLITPYKVVKNGRVTEEIKYLRADEEYDKVLVPADTPLNEDGTFKEKRILARVKGDYKYVDPTDVDFYDVSPKQLVGVSASLIPFLEHDDANRALMGSNMQRQAVPLIVTEPPLVATGMEEVVAKNSSMAVLSDVDGEVIEVDALHIKIKEKKMGRIVEYKLRKFEKLEDKTCLNQKPIVRVGDKVKKGQIIADGAAMCQGELALGRNVLVAFMPWEGYNFEDAIIVSEKLVKEDYYTSIHIFDYTSEIRDTKIGKEEFTREVPNKSDKDIAHLDKDGVVKVGTIVKSGDILIGKVAPKNKLELTPEEKLLYAIFGKAGEDVKDVSKVLPTGVEGIVIDAQLYKKNVKGDKEKQKERKKYEEEFLKIYRENMEKMYESIVKILGDKIICDGEVIKDPKEIKIKSYKELIKELDKIRKKINIYNIEHPKMKDKNIREEIDEIIDYYNDIIYKAEIKKERAISTKGDDIPQNIIARARVYVATKRILSVGDKMAGRHGNKGVIAKILPEEDMPFLEDGTPIEIILNPLGVPSRMNVGQILETHLGWAAKKLGFQAITPVFDGCKEEEIEKCLEEAGLPKNGMVTLYDGRTGEPFEQKVTVGYIYMMKLHHLVDDKVHARATGPYALITQQPMGGKSRNGGQRFGEMEVWAIEAYGAANILQELLTVKSDDVEGRNKMYEAMVKGDNVLEAGTPVSFEVLTHEIKGLALDIQLHKAKKTKTKIDEEE